MNEHVGLLLQLGYTRSRIMPNSWFTIDTIASNGSYTQTQRAQFNGGFQVTPEVRYYFKGEGTKGFYLGFYLRYSQYSLQSTLLHREDLYTPMKTYVFKGTLRSTYLGFIMGNQWRLGENLSLDWWILGLQFGRDNIAMSATGDFSSINKFNFVEDILANINKVPFVKGPKVSVTNTEVSVNFGFPATWIRTGLCLGYRF